MLTHDWADPRAARRAHTLYAVRLLGGRGLLHAYALRRPDGQLALLLLNLSPVRAYSLRIRLAGARLRLRGPLQRWTLSSADYAWRAAEGAGGPSLDQPPVHSTLRGLRAGARPVVLAPYSVTVLRSALG